MSQTDVRGMAGTYSFSIDVNRSLVTIRIAGFFTREEVHRFSRCRDEAYGALESAPNEHVTLVDMQGMAIQTQDVVTAFAHLLGEPRHQSRKLAFVVTTSLARKQVERAASGREARFFRNRQEARDWLLSQGDVSRGDARTGATRPPPRRSADARSTDAAASA